MFKCHRGHSKAYKFSHFSSKADLQCGSHTIYLGFSLLLSWKSMRPLYIHIYIHSKSGITHLWQSLPNSLSRMRCTFCIQQLVVWDLSLHLSLRFECAAQFRTGFRSSDCTTPHLIRAGQRMQDSQVWPTMGAYRTHTHNVRCIAQCKSNVSSIPQMYRKPKISHWSWSPFIVSATTAAESFKASFPLIYFSHAKAQNSCQEVHRPGAVFLFHERG